MKHRISAGALVVQNGKLLLVNHVKEGHYDFWVAPGGGVIGTESIQDAAVREVKEETGLDARVDRLAYIEEYYTPETRGCKFWFYAKAEHSQTITVEALEAVREGIVAASFLSPDEFRNKTVFPPVLQTEFWEDLNANFPEPKCLGVRRLEFW